VTAIAVGAKRALRPVKFVTIDFPGVPSTEYKQGSLVGFDVVNDPGLLVLGGVSATFDPIGHVIDSVTLGSGGGIVHVRLFREVSALYYVNAASTDAVLSTNVGGVAYVVDDQTVANNDATNTRSALGRIWGLNTIKGVLVEPIAFPVRASTSGLDN
jgi:hypothetical protein